MQQQYFSKNHVTEGSEAMGKVESSKKKVASSK